MKVILILTKQVIERERTPTNIEIDVDIVIVVDFYIYASIPVI